MDREKLPEVKVVRPPTPGYSAGTCHCLQGKPQLPWLLNSGLFPFGPQCNTQVPDLWGSGQQESKRKGRPGHRIQTANASKPWDSRPPPPPPARGVCKATDSFSSNRTDFTLSQGCSIFHMLPFHFIAPQEDDVSFSSESTC